MDIFDEILSRVLEATLGKASYSRTSGNGIGLGGREFSVVHMVVVIIWKTVSYKNGNSRETLIVVRYSKGRVIMNKPERVWEQPKSY